MRRSAAITCGVMLVAVVLGLSGQAQAASISHPNGYFDVGGEAKLKLVNFESAFSDAWSDSPGSWTPTGSIGVGTYLRGIFQITTSSDLNSSAASLRVSDGSFELTGEFSARVSRVESLGGGDAIFELIPDSAFETEYGDGAMVAFYHDGTVDFSGGGTLASSVASAVGGALYMVLGAPPAAGGGDGVWGTDYFWGANGSTTPGVAAFAASIALLTNNTGIASHAFVDVTQDPPNSGAATFTNEAGLSSILNEFALQGNTVPLTSGPWQLRSEDPLRAHVVPLPMAAWPGLALLGLLGFVRFRRRAAKIA